MQPRQLFLPADNEDGFVAVVCHRPDKDLEILVKAGWVESVDDLPKPKKKAKKEEPEDVKDDGDGS